MYIPKTGALKSIQQQCGVFYEGMEGGTGKKTQWENERQADWKPN